MFFTVDMYTEVKIISTFFTPMPPTVLQRYAVTWHVFVSMTGDLSDSRAFQPTLFVIYKVGFIMYIFTAV